MRPSMFRRPRFFHLSGRLRRFVSHETQSKPSTSTKPTNPSTASETAQGITTHDAQKQQTQLDRLLKRSPRLLHRHIAALRSAPVTHISAFLILHEITAIVPLLGLAGAFHYYNWLPAYFSEGAWVVAGVEKFGRYFRRKGWISGEEEHQAEQLAEEGDADKVEESKKSGTGKWWTRGEGGVRLVVEFATAYAIVKALLIPRLIVSAWGAPWFARWTIVPIMNGFKSIFGRSKTPIRG